VVSCADQPIVPLNVPPKCAQVLPIPEQFRHRFHSILERLAECMGYHDALMQRIGGNLFQGGRRVPRQWSRRQHGAVLTSHGSESAMGVHPLKNPENPENP
jgi:hypothetical protein